MEYALLSKLDSSIKNYQQEHRGELPLYIIVSPDESEQLMEEVRKREGHAEDVTVTSFKGMKIMPSDTLKPGEVRLTNELPEVSS